MLILQIRKRNIVMMFLTFAVLLLTYANTVKATLISGIAEDTVYYHGTNHVLVTAALVMLMAMCLFQNWLVRIIRFLGYLANAVFWVIYIRLVIPMMIPMTGIYPVVYTYTFFGYTCMILSFLLAGCAASSLRDSH